MGADGAPLDNRSEIVFLYDATDCNPNGNPLSAHDKPRIDEMTGQAVVTDVRLKRYLRDQLDDDGFGIYVRNPAKAPYEDVPGRDELFRRATDLDDEAVEDTTPKQAVEAFLSRAVDVRYFGATCAFSSSFRAALGSDFPGQFIGPVQFEHARSMHAVTRKTETKQLSTVVPSKSNNTAPGTPNKEEQGTFGTDNRLAYALVTFHGVVNENAAADTNLSTADVKRLDSLCWRALKNQTLTRSKMGHRPRLYLRVEYATDDYHHGALDHGIARRDDAETDGTDYRHITDVPLAADRLIEILTTDRDRIDTVHVVADDAIDITVNGRGGGPEALYTALRDALGESTVQVIDPFAKQARK